MTDIQQQFNTAPSEASTDDDRTPDERKQEAELAIKLSRMIEEANEKVVPLVKMVRKVTYLSMRWSYPTLHDDSTSRTWTQRRKKIATRTSS